MESKADIKIARAGKLSNFTTPSARFVWVLGRLCNYSCSYCYVANKEKFHYPTEEELFGAARKIIASTLDNIRVWFTGGEPTIHPSIIPLIDLLHSGLSHRLKGIRIQTNGSASLEFYRQLYKVFPACELNISIHLEYINEEAFIEKIQVLSDMGFSGRLLLMYNMKERERCKNLFEKLLAVCRKNSFLLSLSALRLLHNGKYLSSEEYTSEDHQWMEQSLKLSEHTINTRAVAQGAGTFPTEENPTFVDIKTATGSLKRYFYAMQEMLDTDILCFKGMHCIPAVGAIMIQADGALQCGVCNNSPISNNIYTDEISLEKLITPQVLRKHNVPAPLMLQAPNGQAKNMHLYT